jgi:penicillin-binding protein 1A
MTPRERTGTSDRRASERSFPPPRGSEADDAGARWTGARDSLPPEELVGRDASDGSRARNDDARASSPRSPSLVAVLDAAERTSRPRFWSRVRRGAPGAIRWGKRLTLALALVAVAAAVAIVVVVRQIEAELPSVADLKGNYHPPQVTRVLARDGTLLAELFTERRTVVPIASLPAHVKLAVLAAEDAGFYEHEGLNYLGIVRAFVVNLKSGKKRQGGSTITQQVVKNLLLDAEKTYKRKLREALLARRLEQELSKDDILELYLNHIYFGHGRYGIEEASRDNFGKPARELTIAEAALLAGVVAGPESFSPRRDLKKSLTRRAFVLGQMQAKGFLNDAQHEAAKDEPVRLAPVVEDHSELAPEAVELARRMLNEVAPEQAKRGGFTITTSIDPRLQAAARKAVRENLAAYDKRHGVVGPLRAPASADRKGKLKPVPPREAPFEGTPTFEAHKILVGTVSAVDDAAGTIDIRVGTVTGSLKLADYPRYNPNRLAPSAFAPIGSFVRVSLLAPVPETPAGGAAPSARVPLRLESGPQGALVALDVRTRNVLALVGNYEAASGGLDRATQARRQPGSTFKPIVYSYALHARRYTPATLVDVNPEVFDGGYKPTNYEGWTARDPLRLREALANSVNVAAVRVLRDVGPVNVVQWAQSLGIRSTMKPDLSLALGSYELTPMELAGAYATFAAGGVYEEPRVILRIVGADGKDIPLKAPTPARRVLEEAEAYITTSMLMSVVDRGTAVRAKSLGRPLAGKTGTTNAAKDTWFAGYSTEIAAVSWTGYDDTKPLGGESGASAALPAWMGFMKVAHEGKPPSEFPRPPGVSPVMIDAKTGKLPYDGDADVIEEVFLLGTEPTEVADPPNPYDDLAHRDGAEVRSEP